MEDLIDSFENIEINQNLNQTILVHIKKYLHIIHCNHHYTDSEVQNVHTFWKSLNKIYKQNLLDYINETIHYNDNLINNYLKMEHKTYKANILLFTYYLTHHMYE